MEFTREFFYDEVRDGFYIPGIIKRAWAAELEVLAVIHKICKKNKIRYYADFGTLLGAVRENNFIAWDDDLDIMMLREDFERFVKVVKKSLPKELKFNAVEINKDSCSFLAAVGLPEMKYQDDILRKYHEFPYPAVVDIFVVDELAKDPEDEKYRMEVLSMLGTMLKGIVNQKENTKIFQKELKAIEDLLQYKFSRDLPLEGQFYAIMNKVFQEYNGEGGDMLACMPFRMMDEKACFPKSAFEGTTWIPFCNTEIPAPKGYDSILRAKYGDYLKPVKAGGGHGYPYFKRYIDTLKSVLKDKWNFEYQFSEEDLEHKKESNFRDMVLATWEYLEQKNKKIFESFKTGDFALCLQLMGQIQEEAIAFGNAIEAKKGEGSETVSYLEKYCEALYHSFQSLEQALPLQETDREKKGPAGDFPASLWKDLQNTVQKPGSYLKKVKLAIEKDFKRTVLFLPSRYEQLNSFQALYEALYQMEDVECKIMPIPYFDRLGDGALGEMHYEGEEFQKRFPILNYKDYNFASERPDCIVLLSPYDEYNQVFSVDPFFYSKNMKNFTNKLVYIPSFVTDEINPKSEEDGKAFGNMDYYVTMPGLFHADFTIVQSEDMKKAYLSKISAFTDSAIRKRMASKISGAGSCLFGEDNEKGSKAVTSAFRRFLMKKEANN